MLLFSELVVCCFLNRGSLLFLQSLEFNILFLSGNGVNHFHFSGERNLRCIQSCGSSDLPTRIHPHLRYRSFIFMIRAARHASQHRVRFLLDQLLFYYRLKLLMLELQFRLEETLDTLFDLGFENHDITRDLEVARRANQLFMTVAMQP